MVVEEDSSVNIVLASIGIDAYNRKERVDDNETSFTFEEAMDLVESRRACIGQKNLKRRSEMFTFTAKLSADEKLEAAHHGVGGKRFKKDPSVKINRVRSKMPMSPDVRTDDIDTFLYAENMRVMSSKAKFCHINKNVDDLILKAEELSGGKNYVLQSQNKKLITQVESSEFMQSMQIISEIIEEINYSRNHYCNPREFIVKKLKDRPIYILMKPASPNNFIHYCIFGLNEYYETKHHGIFRNVRKCGKIWITEFPIFFVLKKSWLWLKWE